MTAVTLPVFVPEGLTLDWLDDMFDDLADIIDVPAASLASDYPSAPIPLDSLRLELAQRERMKPALMTSGAESPPAAVTPAATGNCGG